MHMCLEQEFFLCGELGFNLGLVQDCTHDEL